MISAINVEGVSKQYRLGLVGTGTLAHDINRFLFRIRGKEDPYLKIGEVNDRTKKNNDDYVWALKDVSFSVKQGEVLGIVGRNGAGKSTLLKILSRTTSPSTGHVKIRGRIASLLEVGTGFHPELTGRENVFLNGAILGMRKHEIEKKFDEIVAFSGVEKYIDTPVKRYSSGMYVRLAFGVAAHLESEILIIDEVLAVGDAEFQRKCLGKMKQVSEKNGRTILFVSHNMTAVKNLCTKVLHIEQGSVLQIGQTELIVNRYLSQHLNNDLAKIFENWHVAPGNELVRLKRIQVIPRLAENTSPLTVETEIDVEFEFWNKVVDKKINLSLVLNSISDECIFNVGSEAKMLNDGIHRGVCHIPGNLLNDGIYKISMMVVAEQAYPLFYFVDIVTFEVNESREISGWHGKWVGFIRPKMLFTLE